MVFRLIRLGIPDDLINGQRPDLQEDSGLPFCKIICVEYIRYVTGTTSQPELGDRVEV